MSDAVAASGAGMSVGDALADARMIKACGQNGVWTTVNCKKKRTAVHDALNTSLEIVPNSG